MKDIKIAARARINYLVREGRMEKPSQCSKCGWVSPRSCGIHAHHIRHENRDEIIWVCAKCHYKMDPHPNPCRNGATKSTGGTRKIPISEYENIWNLYMVEKMSQPKIAAKYGVSISGICRIIGKIREGGK